MLQLLNYSFDPSIDVRVANVTVVEYLNYVCPGLEMELGREWAKTLSK